MKILDSILEQIRLRPEAPAIDEAGCVLSYAELGNQVEALAEELRSRPICGHRIALDLPRSAAFVIGVLAAWRCGSSFVPIHDLPEERRRFILEEAGVAAIIGRPQETGSPELDLTTPKTLPTPKTPPQEAWLIYTSGSSGQAKGVSVGHGGIPAVIRQQIAAFELGPGSRCLWMLSPLFDASLSDILSALASGATLVIAPPCELSPERLLRTLAERDISYLDIPPSLLRLLAPEDAPDCLLTLGFGGEICPQETVQKWCRRVRLFNLYGPTEASICCSLIRCGPDWCEGDIGRPLEGAEFRLDENSGELLIGGPCLALGYWQRPELNAAKFFELDGRHFYRSGDRAERLADGKWRFLGRLDRQIKLRGKLVECGEVESTLLRLPGVTEAAVFLHGPHLIGAFSGPADSTDLRRGLSTLLPEWMIPAKFLRLPQMPRTSSGKVDYPSLTAAIQTPSHKLAATHFLALAEDYFGYAIDPELPLRQQGLDSLGAFELAAKLQASGMAWTPEELMRELPVSELKSSDHRMSVERLRQDTGLNTQASQLAPQRGGRQIAQGVATRHESQTLGRRFKKIEPQRGVQKPVHALGATFWTPLRGCNPHISSPRVCPRSSDYTLGYLPAAPPGQKKPQSADKALAVLGFRSLFLTGASGFLGLELLCHLQRRWPHTRFLLLQRGGIERLRQLAEKRGLHPDFERLEIISGDLSQEGLGLDETSRQKILAAEIFVHAAAELNSSRSCDQLTKVNVDATRALAELYLAGSGKRFHFVSTLAVFVCSDAPPGSIAEDTEPSGNIIGAYAQTKLAAEFVLRRLIGFDRGLRIIRPALIGGASDRDDLPQQDFFTWMLQALARHPLAPEAVPADLELAVSPLEAYAAAMQEIIYDDLPGPCFHLAPRRHLSLRQLCAASCDFAGRPGLDLESWRQRQVNSPLLPALNGLFSQRCDQGRAHDLFLASGFNFQQAALPEPTHTDILRYLRQVQKPLPHDKVGLVLGKFLPPHLGHLFLVEFARRRVERLYIVVGSLKAEPIPGERRFDWMRQLCPDCIVLHLTDENPQQPEEHPDFWGIWERSLKRLLPEPVDFVFASESYGTPLAAVLGAEFSPCDIPRSTVPVSGTAVRQNPAGNWAFLPPPAQAYYRRRICLFGPESCGKSTLAAQLADHFGGSFVPEFARIYLEELGRDPIESDMPLIARGQIALQKKLEATAGPWLFCDTDALCTCIWQEFLFGHRDPLLEELAAALSCELTLLCDVDLPWVADPVRYLPEDRAAFLATCQARLDAAGRPWRLVSGQGEERLRNAIAAIEEYFSTQGARP